MGNTQSSQAEKQQKADKLEWEARQARERADAATRGVPWEKKKYLPPGTYEARPAGMVTESRYQTMPSRPSQVSYQPERHEVVFEAPSADRPGERQALARQQQPTYRVMDVSQNYDASQGPAQHQQPPTEVRYPAVQSWTQREEHPIGQQTSQTSRTSMQTQSRPQAMAHGPLSSDTRLLELPPDSANALERLRQVTSREKVNIDRQMHELGVREHEESGRFRKAAEREKEMRLIEERELETLAELRRERAALLHRQRQLKENEACRQQLLKETKPEWDQAFETRMGGLDVDLNRLHQIEEEERNLEKQLQLEANIVTQSKTAREAEEIRLAKLREAEENLRKEREKLGRLVQELSDRERKHAAKVQELRTRETEISKKDKELRAVHALKEKRVHEMADAEFNKNLPLTPADAELSEVEKRFREIDALENEAKSREAEAEKALKEAQRECDETRSNVKKFGSEREKLEASRPVIPAKQVCAEIIPMFKKKTEEFRTSREAPVTISEKFSQFSEQNKFQTGKSGVPEAPPLSEKTKTEYVEHEKHFPIGPDHPGVPELQKQHERLHHTTTHVHSCPCPVTHGGHDIGRSPAQTTTRITSASRQLAD
jgi:myosin heavy subunit